MKKMLIFMGFCLAIGLGFVSCSKTTTSSDVPTTVVGTAGSYQGAGSRWSATFTTTNFIIEKFPDATSTSADNTVNGTYVQYSSGFRKLTVTSATGTGAPVAGDQAYGFEVPGFAFFLKPIGSNNSEPIIMVNAGSCPSGTGFDANWIIAKFDSGTILNDTKDTFGKAVFNMTTPATSTATIDKLSAETAAPLGTNAINFDYTTCANGKLTFPAGGGETVDMFFTQNGGALVHSSNGTTHNNIIFAAPKHTAAVTQSDLAATYSGLVFDGSSGGDKIFPVKITMPSTGNGAANKITDVETDALGVETFPIGNFAVHALSNGLFTLALSPATENGRMSCTYFVISSIKVMACNGYGSAAGTHEPFFLLARSR